VVFKKGWWRCKLFNKRRYLRQEFLQENKDITRKEVQVNECCRVTEYQGELLSKNRWNSSALERSNVWKYS
jgi:hypothetical protein